METQPKDETWTETPAKTEGVDAVGALEAAITGRRFRPSLITTEAWEGFTFAGQKIRIKETTDCYGAVIWPSASVLCYFLDTNRDAYNLRDTEVIELGAGTGLVTVVASLLGAKVTSTDLPDVLANLQYNVQRNTRGRCRHDPEVTELCWGQELERRFPRAQRRFRYVLAADVVYAHPHLDELMDTFEHLCQEGTEILWAMRFRLDKENRFVGRVQGRFEVEELYDLPGLCIKLYRAWRREGPGMDARGA